MDFRIALTLLLSSYCIQVCCQEPAEYLFSVNDLETMLYSNGRISWDGEQGTFRLKGEEGSLIKLGGLWLGGVDGGSNIKAAAQGYEGIASDFTPGMLYSSQDPTIAGFPIGGMNKIWSVTREEIEKHIRDFEENQTIDNPINPIFAWPGRGNPYFEAYNGEELPEVDFPRQLAPFYDYDADGIYNPMKGDYPHNRKTLISDQIAWFTFNDNAHPNDVTNGNPLQFEINCMAYAYQCEEAGAIPNRTIFLEYTIWNKALEPIDSLFAGLLLDYTLGCERNEYMGTFPELNSVYIYEAAPEKDCNNSDVMVSATVVRDMLLYKNHEENAPFQYVPFTNIMPVYLESEGYIPAMSAPENDAEFYNYLTGSWRDGSHLKYGGFGFNPNSNQLADLVFSGFPIGANEWNEINAQQIPGHRRSIASLGPAGIPPGSYRDFTIALTVHPCFQNCTTVGTDLGFYDSFSEIRDLKEWYQRIGHRMDPPPPPTFYCTQEDFFPVDPDFYVPQIIVYPVPTYDFVNIVTVQGTPYWANLYNSQGQLMARYEGAAAFHICQDVRNWNAGIYFLQAAVDGEIISHKFIVQ
jgi:hypothetical protein